LFPAWRSMHRPGAVATGRQGPLPSQIFCFPVTVRGQLRRRCAASFPAAGRRSCPPGRPVCARPARLRCRPPSGREGRDHRRCGALPSRLNANIGTEQRSDRNDRHQRRRRARPGRPAAGGNRRLWPARAAGSRAADGRHRGADRAPGQRPPRHPPRPGVPRLHRRARHPHPAAGHPRRRVLPGDRGPPAAGGRSRTWRTSPGRPRHVERWRSARTAGTTCRSSGRWKRAWRCWPNGCRRSCPRWRPSRRLRSPRSTRWPGYGRPGPGW